MICPNCFSEHVADGVCPDCRYDQNGITRTPRALPLFTILNGKYLVGRVLGCGGFGITYVAHDLAEEKIVAIKECMPELYSSRKDERLYPLPGHEKHYQGCLDCFRDEIESLKLCASNPGVVHYHDSFRENNTQYLVMDFINGVTLKYLTAKSGNRLSLGNSLFVLFLLSSALIEVHRLGIVHLDISPENIMIASDGTVKLIDFGASNNLKKRQGPFATFLKPGFAPPEQYNEKGHKGPWTDIYALAATFYTVVSGQPLIDSNTRSERDTMKPLKDLECNVPDNLSDIIEKAMRLDESQRYATMNAFLDDLSEYISLADGIDDSLMRYVKQYRMTEHRRTAGGKSVVSGMVEPYVEILFGKNAGEKKIIPDYGFITIGKDTNIVDVVVNASSQISRKHCLVGFDRFKNRFIVVDRSTNGTFYSNGVRMIVDGESYLQPNDEFYILDKKYKIKVVLE